MITFWNKIFNFLVGLLGCIAFSLPFKAMANQCINAFDIVPIPFYYTSFKVTEHPLENGESFQRVTQTIEFQLAARKLILEITTPNLYRHIDPNSRFHQSMDRGDQKFNIPLLAGSQRLKDDPANSELLEIQRRFLSRHLESARSRLNIEGELAEKVERSHALTKWHSHEVRVYDPKYPLETIAYLRTVLPVLGPDGQFLPQYKIPTDYIVADTSSPGRDLVEFSNMYIGKEIRGSINRSVLFYILLSASARSLLFGQRVGDHEWSPLFTGELEATVSKETNPLFRFVVPKVASESKLNVAQRGILESIARLQLEIRQKTSNNLKVEASLNNFFRTMEQTIVELLVNLTSIDLNGTSLKMHMNSYPAIQKATFELYKEQQTSD